MGPGWTMAWEGWLWMGLWIVALLVLVWLITRSPDSHRDREEPLEILRARLARGEIDGTEYQRAVRLLDLDKEPRP